MLMLMRMNIVMDQRARWLKCRDWEAVRMYVRLFRAIGVALHRTHDRREVFALYQGRCALARIFLIASPLAFLLSRHTSSVAGVSESFPLACSWRTFGKLALKADGALVDAASSWVTTALSHVHLVLGLSLPLAFSQRPSLFVFPLASFMLAIPLAIPVPFLLPFTLPLAFTINLLFSLLSLLSLLLHFLFPLSAPFD